jgi:N-acetylmuramoyl-L-alanine amidase
MVINVHGGHSLKCRGAKAVLDEVDEDRKVKNKVIELLRAEGHTVYDCTDDEGTTQSANLYNIVKKCNAHAVNLDVSIHLNAGRNDTKGDGKTGGVEVYGYNNDVRDVSQRICQKIASSLGVTNRGFKISTSLYVLRKTKAKAILIECCFVDDRDDAKRWNADKCAVAIVEGILNRPVNVKQPSYFRQYTGTSCSIVDALQAVGVDSSFGYRAKIAAKNGISSYTGRADQNSKMVTLLKQGKLIKP